MLCCRYTCSNRVLSLLRERGLGNSATQINKKIREQHAEDWLRRTACYLSACLPFSTSQLVRYVAATPPAMPSLPQPRWLMTVFVKDVYTRLDDIKAKVTSTYGDVLKMDSTKKVGHWCTSNVYKFSPLLACIHCIQVLVFSPCFQRMHVHVFSECISLFSVFIRFFQKVCHWCTGNQLHYFATCDQILYSNV